MLAEMKARSHMALPHEIIKGMGIREGDKFEVMARDGGLFLCPVVSYPPKKLERIINIIAEHEESASVIYDSIDDMFADLGILIEGDDV